jgi:hypothetical protein
MNKFKKPKKLELLNYEGPVLVAHKIYEFYVITDQWKEVVDVIVGFEMESFFNGKFSITDSKNKEWIYTNEHADAKPTQEKIKQFLND